jgi:hypothetical protein
MKGQGTRAIITVKQTLKADGFFVDPPNAQLAKQKTSLYNFRQVGKTLS